MKLRVKKDGQRVQIEFAADNKSTPAVLVLDTDQFNAWLAAAQTISRASQAEIALELE